MARSGVCLFSLLDFLEVFVLVVGHSTPALSLAFMAENVRNLPLMLSAHEKKKKELNLWASLCLDVQHLKFEFQQVFDHTIPCCKEIYGQQLHSELFIFYCLD